MLEAIWQVMPSSRESQECGRTHRRSRVPLLLPIVNWPRAECCGPDHQHNVCRGSTVGLRPPVVARRATHTATADQFRQCGDIMERRARGDQSRGTRRGISRAGAAISRPNGVAQARGCTFYLGQGSALTRRNPRSARIRCEFDDKTSSCPRHGLVVEPWCGRRGRPPAATAVRRSW